MAKYCFSLLPLGVGLGLTLVFSFREADPYVGRTEGLLYYLSKTWWFVGLMISIILMGVLIAYDLKRRRGRKHLEEELRRQGVKDRNKQEDIDNSPADQLDNPPTGW